MVAAKKEALRTGNERKCDAWQAIKESRADENGERVMEMHVMRQLDAQDVVQDNALKGEEEEENICSRSMRCLHDQQTVKLK